MVYTAMVYICNYHQINYQSFSVSSTITGKMPCKYGPIFALYLYCIESNHVNTMQKRVRIYTAFFLCILSPNENKD